jgi:hypothetical protein
MTMMMMGTGSSARALMIIALGCIVVAQIAAAAEAEEASSEPLMAASSGVMLKDFGPSGYIELPGITRVKPFWRGRKLLAACGLGDVEVNVQMMGLTNGSNHYEIEINWNRCMNPNCRIHNIHVSCPGFVTVDVGPNVFKHVSGSDCIVLNGGYLGWRSRVRMQYIDNQSNTPQLHPIAATVTNC